MGELDKKVGDGRKEMPAREQKNGSIPSDH